MIANPPAAPPSPLCLLRSPVLEIALRQGTPAEVEGLLQSLEAGIDRPAQRAALDHARALHAGRLLHHDQAARLHGQAAARFAALCLPAEAAVCQAERALSLGLARRPAEAQKALAQVEAALPGLGQEARAPVQALCHGASAA